MSGDGEDVVPRRIGIFRRIAVLRYSEPLVGHTPWLRPRVRGVAVCVVAALALAGWLLLAA